MRGGEAEQAGGTKRWSVWPVAAVQTSRKGGWSHKPDHRRYYNLCSGFDLSPKSSKKPLFEGFKLGSWMIGLDLHFYFILFLET